MMKFYKYQGAGNDFLIADNRDGHLFEKEGILYSELPDGTMWSRPVAELCDRRYGVGSDGLMLLESADESDFRMVYFNSDGSGGMMCGNGGRCIVAFADDMGVKPSGNDEYVFEAADGLHTGRVMDRAGRLKVVRLKMKDVSEAVEYDSLSGVECASSGWFLDTGTRHFVRNVENIDSYDVVSEGRQIRYEGEELKPIGANVNFIESEGRVLRVRTYEKGVENETFACGTGIVASALAAHLSGIPASSTDDDSLIYDIKAVRDDLQVKFKPVMDGVLVASDVYLTGPAAYVAQIYL